MSYLNTKNAFIDAIVNTSIANITNDDIAFENQVFDPEGKSQWLAVYFIPATTEIMGKTPASPDEQRGIFQVSVFVAKNSGNYDNIQAEIIDSVISAFSYNTKLSYNGQNVDILSSTVNNGSENDAWFQRDISINYLTFSTRA